MVAYCRGVGANSLNQDVSITIEFGTLVRGFLAGVIVFVPTAGRHTMFDTM